MTGYQFDLLARLLGVPSPARAAARAVLIDGMEAAAATQLQGCATSELDQAMAEILAAEVEIRSAFVLHGPNEFRVTVGHHDTHRMPGAMSLAMDQVVRLVAHSTERWIPVQIMTVPDQVGGYYEGIIVEQLVKASRFQVGDRVRFGEDQVLTTDTENRPGIPGRPHRRFQGRRTAR
ncbi:alpha/beta hydrolase [Bordetella tumulicola]|uniref:alpha/beta hydrolase n=1 Tax=Bordetella tumulicola TaxID=1649133 RepID=UPI0039EE58D9